MRYSQDIIEEVRAGNDIVDVIGGYVALKNKGGSFFGLCPFHNEKTPSFSVSRDKQMYYCFGCGAGGNVISFVMQIENYDFLDAFKFLADRIHYVLPKIQSEAVKAGLRNRDALREVNRSAARFYYDVLLSEDGVPAQKYLDERGIAPSVRKRFGLGFSTGNWDSLLKNLQKHGFNISDMVELGLVKSSKKGQHYDRFRERLMFPIMDIDSHVVGFGGRIMNDNENAAKYLNSPETPLFDKSRQLYGIHIARKARHKEIIVVEGYMDVLSLHQAGYPQTIGILGTALTAFHARLLKRINASGVVLLFDRDTAGAQAVARAIPVMLKAGLSVKCLQVTEDVKDPDEYIQKYGPARFGQLLMGAKNHAAFQIEMLTKQHDLTNTEERITFTQKAAIVLASLESTIEADAYIRETAKLTGIAPEAIFAEMDKQRGRLDGGEPIFLRTGAPRDRPGLRYSLNGRQQERGLIDARKGLIFILLTYPEICKKMQNYLNPEEMGEAVTNKLLEIVYENTGKDAADIITRFETLEEQKQVAEILKEIFYFDDIEKAVNEMWKVIKRAWFDAQLEQKESEIDINAVNTLIEAKRNLEKQHITIMNG